VASTAAGHDHPVRRNPGDRHQDQHALSSRADEAADEAADGATHHGLPDRGADNVADDSSHHRRADPGRNPHPSRYSVHRNCHHRSANADLIARAIDADLLRDGDPG
jgi:hypothetical protein